MVQISRWVSTSEIYIISFLFLDIGWGVKYEEEEEIKAFFFCKRMICKGESFLIGLESDDIK